jgi:hypothetical protein
VDERLYCDDQTTGVERVEGEGCAPSHDPDLGHDYGEGKIGVKIANTKVADGLSPAEFRRTRYSSNNSTFTWSGPRVVAGYTEARTEVRQSCQSAPSDP